MKLSELEILIDKYLSDQATDKEKAIVENWLQHNPDEARIQDPQKRQELIFAIWVDVLAKIDAQPEINTGKLRSIRRIQKKYLIRIAAALLFVAMTGILIYYISRNNISDTTSYASVTASDSVSMKHVLPDGSVAWIFPGSSISVPADYNVNDRHVQVTGRAFFDVKQQNSKPFYADAGALQTLVLGTSFEVNTLQHQHPAVVVRTGRVAVSWQGKQLTQLTPDRRVTLDLSENQALAAVDVVNAGSLCTWWSGAFNFEQTLLPEVLQNLSQWYKLPINIGSAKWQKEKLTIQIETNLSIRDAMRLICETIGAEYSISAEGITIR